MAWHDRFFRGLYAKVLASQFTRATNLRDARLIRRLLQVRRGQRVLDLPCGMGRMTLPLARLGLKMTGIDREPGYITRARKHAKRARLRIDFRCADMRDLASIDEYDAVLNWFGSFGYFSDAGNLDVCKRAFQALKPGGRFLVDGPNKSFILSHFSKGTDERVGGVRIVHRPAWDPRSGRAITRWTFIQGSRRETHTSSMRIYSGGELRSILQEAGFRNIRLFDRKGRRFTRFSRRLIAVGRKPIRT